MFVYCLTRLWEVFSKDVTTSLFVFFGVLLLVRVLQLIDEVRKLPPGPWGLPIVGSLPFLKGDLHLQFRDLADKYGPVFSIRLGSQLFVVISDYHLIRESFRKDEFAGRPNTEFTKILGGYGLINTEGNLWKQQRRFVHVGLRNFGMSFFGGKKELMETRIMREVEEIIGILNEKYTEPIDLNTPFAVSISNVICDMIMSVRFSHNDSRFKRYMNLIDEGFKLFGSLSPALFIPILKYLPGLKKTRQQIEENRVEMATFLQETIDDHRKTFDSGHVRDLLDEYLSDIQRADEEGVGHHLFEGKDHDRQMQQIMGDLFSAGMETTKSSLQWAILFMLHHPELMQVVQEELDQVVGRHRLPTLEDIPFLPITESTIYEVLRRSSIVPMGTTHAPTKDLEMGGYSIPKNAQIVPLLHTIHMDPKLWKDPESFDPSRFIDAEGKLKKPEYFLPFGVGRRMCLGEVMARMEMFLFFSSFLHSFHLSVPEGDSLPSMEGNAGVTINPNPFKVCLKPRPLISDLDQGLVTMRSAGCH